MWVPASRATAAVPLCCCGRLGSKWGGLAKTDATYPLQQRGKPTSKGDTSPGAATLGLSCPLHKVERYFLEGFLFSQLQRTRNKDKRSSLRIIIAVMRQRELQGPGTDAEAIEGCCLLTTCGLIGLFSYRIQDQPRSGTMHNGLGPLPPTAYQEMALQACLQSNLKEAFFQLRSLLPDDSSLCHSDIKLATRV